MEEFIENLSVENVFGYVPTSEEMSLKDFPLNIGELIDFSRPTFWVSVFSFLFAPLYWNTVARFEYKTRLITKLFCGANYLACYLLALSIFFLQIERDIMYVVGFMIIGCFLTSCE